MTGLGFASGIPFPLVYITQSAWLSEAGVAIQTLGLMSEMTIAYKFKFLWAPFLDHYDPPFLAALLGRRRGWIIWSQIAVMLMLAGVAFGDPAHFLAWTVAFSLALGVAGATQDVVIDGWRINAAPIERQPLMSACAEMGWRTGIACSAGLALAIGGHYGWRLSYLCMAAAMTVGVISCLFAPEPDVDFHHPPASGKMTNLLVIIFEPIKEMATRLGPLAAPIFLMVAGFRMPGYISNAMAMPLFKSLHYDDAEIALVTKGFGFAVGIAGVFCASIVARRIGLMKTLIVGTVAGSASHLSLAWLAAHGGGSFWMLATAVSIENFAAAFASIVLISYMSSLTTAELAGSQYALLTSLCAMPGSLLAGSSGFIIKNTGFENFFVLTSLIGLPVALLSIYVARRHAENIAAAAQQT
jgi:PAT family beta-lactamase induction signal transducer AmpG